VRKSLKNKIQKRIGRSKRQVFLREDFEDMGGYDQIGRALKGLVDEQFLIRIGTGIYTLARLSTVTGEPTIAMAGGFKLAALEALKRLEVEWELDNNFEKRYNANKSTQIPANTSIIINGRFNRKIEFGKLKLHYLCKPQVRS